MMEVIVARIILFFVLPVLTFGAGFCIGILVEAQKITKNEMEQIKVIYEKSIQIDTEIENCSFNDAVTRMRKKYPNR